MTDWIVEPAGPLSGDVAVPGDKSIGHRAVLFAALTDGPCEVTGLSGGEDNLRTVAALQALGVRVAEGVVQGVGLDGLRAAAAPLDCGNSGTSMRLLTGLLAAQPFRSELVGDEYLHRRPMRRVAEPLGRMGARVAGRPGQGKKAGEIYPPLVVEPAGTLRGIDYESPVASAQVKSAILLAGLYARGRTSVREPGPSRDHTERMLRFLGAPIATGERTTAVDPDGWDRRLRARPLRVPGDPSSAAFLLAAALVTGGTVRVRGACVNPTRTGFLDAIAAMGADVALENPREEAGEPIADVVVRGGRPLRGVDLAGDLVVRAIDEVPILAVVAARAEGTTTIRDAAELRVKESDRVATTVALLRAFGVAADEREDGLAIAGGTALRPGDVDSHGDHRIAMAAAVAAAVAGGRVVDVANVATSFPTFARLLRELGARVSESSPAR
ncbi:MAG TPA: 3-phosphoshikimate 1-carboxyvinyltransferase [Haliangiales bacterium]|nr:3-phosphoshikimate 1-carboxyvinyltransferase [Haliangiales bacterium]